MSLVAPKPMLRQNSELRPDRIWNYSIPAWFTEIDGQRFMTCPSAGPCAQLCYARNGTYLFPAVLAAHRANLERYLSNPEEWFTSLTTELAAKRFRPTGEPRDLPTTGDAWLDDWAARGGAAVRIHDSGDFFSAEYLGAWLAVAAAVPDVLFYAYTKEVTMFRNAYADEFPVNFRYLFSTGGIHDALIDPDQDRHADVFPGLAEIEAAGYESQDASDLLAIFLSTTRVGIPANNIRHFRKRQGEKRFSQLAPPKRRLRDADGQ